MGKKGGWREDQGERPRQDQGGGSTRGRATQDTQKHIREELGRLAEWDAADLVKRADEIGNELSRRMTTTKIRGFLDEVNRIDAEHKGKKSSFDSSQVILLKPLLAYAAGRERGEERRILTDFADLFSAAADKVNNAEDFKRFVDFTRAVVAYHRYHGGSNQ